MTKKYFSKRGDTKFKSCKEADLGFRLDLRIIAFTSSQNFDVLNGEVVKMAATKGILRRLTVPVLNMDHARS